ncbi:MAG: amidase [Ornithinimicrobium sp.]
MRTGESDLVALAARLGLDARGRTGRWLERLGQDEALVDLVRTWRPPVNGTGPRPTADIPGPQRRKASPSQTQSRSWTSRSASAARDRVEESLAVIQATADGNAFTSVWPDDARAQAIALDSRARAGELMGPLYGAVVAVKDIMQVRGRSATGGTRALITPRAEHDAEAVRRLRMAGAVLVGATNLHALAFGPFSTSSDSGVVANPLCRGVVAGGSSGGSAAAVATGAVDLALGTDTAGSVRIPSALCGVVGMKGTLGIASMAGVHPLAPSLDHVGPIARTVTDLAAGWRALCGETAAEGTERGRPQPVTGSGLRGVVIGDGGDVLRRALDESVRDAFENALQTARRCGARVQPVHLPELHRVPGAMMCTIGPEAADTYRDVLKHRAEMLPDDVRLRLETGAFIAAADYVRAQHLRAQLRQEVTHALRGVDMLLTPTLPLIAPHLDGSASPVRASTQAARAQMSRFTALANLTGHPSLTVPWAHDPHGGGVGVQLIGSWRGEDHLMTVAFALERARGEGARHDNLSYNLAD